MRFVGLTDKYALCTKLLAAVPAVLFLALVCGCGGEVPGPAVPTGSAVALPTGAGSAAPPLGSGPVLASITPEHLFARLDAGALSGHTPALAPEIAHAFTMFPGASGLTWVARGSVLYRAEASGVITQDVAWVNGLPAATAAKDGRLTPLVPVALQIARTAPADGDLIGFGELEGYHRSAEELSYPWNEAFGSRPWRQIDAVYTYAKGAWIRLAGLTRLGGYAYGEAWRPVAVGSRGTLLVADLGEPDGAGLPNLVDVSRCRRAGLKYLAAGASALSPVPLDLAKAAANLCVRDVVVDHQQTLFVAGYTDKHELMLVSSANGRRVPVAAQACVATADPRLATTTIMHNAGTPSTDTVEVHTLCVKRVGTGAQERLVRDRDWSLFDAVTLAPVTVVGGAGMGSSLAMVLRDHQLVASAPDSTGKVHATRIEVWNAWEPLLATHLEPTGWGLADERADPQRPASGAYLFFTGDRGKTNATSSAASDPRWVFAPAPPRDSIEAPRRAWQKKMQNTP